MIFFGGGQKAPLRSYTAIDDQVLLPAGLVHVRLFNGLEDHQPIQPVQCTNDFATAPAVEPCAPLAAPIAYGEVWEMDVPVDVAGKLAWIWISPDEPNPSPNALLTPASASQVAFVTMSPVRVVGASGPCPSCTAAATEIVVERSPVLP